MVSGFLSAKSEYRLLQVATDGVAAAYRGMMTVVTRPDYSVFSQVDVTKKRGLHRGEIFDKFSSGRAATL